MYLSVVALRCVCVEVCSLRVYVVGVRRVKQLTKVPNCSLVACNAGIVVTGENGIGMVSVMTTFLQSL